MSQGDSTGPRYAAAFPAEDVAVSAIRSEISAIAARCGLTAAEIQDVRIAVSEIVTNAIVHAYADGPGEIRVAAQVLDGHLEVVIADDGPGMAPRVGSPGLGLGLPTAATAASDLTVVTPPQGGTEVRLKFRCPERAG